ncbi:hypothetical protein AGMMS49965_16080 [Bacteroidia bacterium]|nr:hypothetical protein AGMMS49965_16080 [Bacteroidia bacterium]
MKNKFLKNGSFALLLYGVVVCMGGGVQRLWAEAPQEAKIAVIGVVSDAEGPIIGASVVEKGNPGNGVATDVYGRYTIGVSSDAVRLLFMVPRQLTV